MTINNPEELQIQLEVRRVVLNLSVRQVASLAGIDKNTCSRILRGMNCRWDCLLAVANAIRNEELRRAACVAGGDSGEQPDAH